MIGPKFEKNNTSRAIIDNLNGPTDPSPSIIEKGHNHLEYIYENEMPKQMPKGYAKSVERLRKHKETQDKLKQDEEMRERGLRYNKEKLEKMKPPSFLSDAER